MMFHFRLITLAYHFDHNLTDTIIFYWVHSIIFYRVHIIIFCIQLKLSLGEGPC